ncbi:MAG: tetratricopeptide repeat protein [Planctomycetaceae bacterium]
MTSATKLLQQAVRHEECGELQASEETLKKLITRHPKHGEALHLMGGVILKQQRPEDAFIYFQRSLENGCESSSLFSNMGATCRQMGKYTDAIMYYTKAIELDSTYCPAWFNLGILHEMQGRLELARDCYQKTIELKPEFSAAHNNLASLLPKLEGSQGQVLQLQEKAVELKPQNASYQNNLGRTLYAEGRREESLECFKRAIELSPRNADYMIDCAVVLNMMERQQEALDLLHKALELDPANQVGIFNAGKIHHNQGRFKQAAEFFYKLLEINSNHVQGILNLAKCEREFRNFAESGKLFKQYQELGGDEKVTLLNLAFNDIYQDKLESAEDLINRSLAMDPKYAEALEALAQIRRKQQDFAGERDILRQVCMFKPKDENCRLLLANCHSRLDESKSCLDRLMQVINLNDKNVKAWFMLGNLWGQNDDNTEAIKCYRKAIELCPDHAAAHSNIAELSRGSGDLETARKHFELSLQAKYDPSTRLKLSVLLPPIIKSREDILETRRVLEQNFDDMIRDNCFVHPDQVVTPTLFYLAYHGMNDRPLLEKYSQLVKPSPLFVPSSRVPKVREDGRMRIGFISHHFKNHTIGNLNQGLIREINRDKFHITILSQKIHEDQMGKFFQQEADQYVHIGSEVGPAIEKIKGQDLDLLHYPDLGMDPFTFSLSHLRLAPVQSVSWGHPVTSGSPEIDYYVSTELIDTPDAQQYFTEELVEFKTTPTFFYYPHCPEKFHTREELGLPEAGNLYVCPQTLFKFHPDLDDIFHGILKRDPNGYVILIQGVESIWEDQLKVRYNNLMTPEQATRIIFLPRLDHYRFMSLIHHTDVMLDTPHFGGGNTTYQALALGIPIVTCPPVHQRGRFTQGLYRKIGVTDCIVNSFEEYIELSVELALNREKRQAIQDKILAAKDVLFREKAAVTEFEEFFERVIEAARKQ